MTGKDGWYINLDETGTFGKEFKAERVVTTPSVRTNGLVFFSSTFKPTADICGFGGETLFWLVNYGTGGAPRPAH